MCRKVFPDLDVKYFIKKPITIAELVAKINQALNNGQK
jgi:hypothetical protein